MENILKKLSQIAEIKSVPFCYSCYAKAPSGKCVTCGSDDLMRELQGVGCEYGLDWIIKDLLNVNLSPADLEEEFSNRVDDCYSDTVTVGWIEINTAHAIKCLDPIWWNMALQEYIDDQVEQENLITLDNGKTYYFMFEVERFIEQEIAIN